MKLGFRPYLWQFSEDSTLWFLQKLNFRSSSSWILHAIMTYLNFKLPYICSNWEKSQGHCSWKLLQCSSNQNSGTIKQFSFKKNSCWGPFVNILPEMPKKLVCGVRTFKLLQDWLAQPVFFFWKNDIEPEGFMLIKVKAGSKNPYQITCVQLIFPLIWMSHPPPFSEIMFSKTIRKMVN